MENKREQEQLLVLKVMRLTKPTLIIHHPIQCDTRDLPGETFDSVTQSDLAVVQALPNFSAGELLTLPQNFGSIFLGETFSCYISVHNDSSVVCKDIIVKADLQTSTQRIALNSVVGNPTPQLTPDKSIDDVIHHEVKEMGTHILVCAVTYQSQTGEKLYFRKFFKFQVLKPLDVKTKFYNAEIKARCSGSECDKNFLLQSNDVYLEAQVQNITPGVISLERVALEPSPPYLCQEIGHNHEVIGSNSEKVNISVFGYPNCMHAMEIRQYLFCLSPNPANDNKSLKGFTNIGRLDITWKTNMGEKGRLQTSALQRVAPGYGDIRVTVESIPAVVPLHQVFKVKLMLINCSDRSMDLDLYLQNSSVSGLAWCDISGRHLGKLDGSSHQIIELQLLPLRDGLQTISGIRVKELFLQRTYELDDITQIFVSKNQPDISDPATDTVQLVDLQ